MNKIIILAVTAGLALTSCKKNLEDKFLENQKTATGSSTVSANKMSDIKVPAGFKWETSRDVNLKITTSDVRFGNALHTVAVYSADPNQGGILLASGSVSSVRAFEATINTANTIQEYFIVKHAPDQSQSMEKVKIQNNAVNLNIAVAPSVKLNKTSGPDCSTGCTSTISLTSGTYTASSGTICITNLNINGNLTIANGATVKICGTGTINSLNLNSSSTLIITSTASITFNQKVTSKGDFTNYGTIVTNQDFEADKGTFTNNGTLTVGNDLKTKSNGTIINNGTLIVDNDHQTDKGSTTNNCYFWVKKSWEINGTNVNSPVFFNNGYLRVDDNSNINDKAAMTLTSGAMFKTKTIDFQEGKIIGTAGSGSATSLLKVTNGGSINSNASVSGLVEVCYPSSFSSSVLTSGASAGCSLYIPVSSCNPDGNGTIPSTPISDTDGDGVADSNDDYPTDPNKAYNNAYGTSTVAFEDLWPFKGDYDLNDVVVNYTYNVVTNAANNVVRVEATYVLRATGGSFNNGFAVQFPINRSAVSGVSGATLEAGQTKAVLVIFNNMRSEMNRWNTVIGEPTSAPITYNVAFNVSGAPSLASFGLGAYNPFIWNGTAGFGRGYEIHLPGQLPTDLATTSLFGTGSDATNLGNGDTYVSKDGRYPWAINIPVSFAYPKEKADINTAYNHFASWVSSGGSSYADWYTNGSGYRNAANIYQ
jgi:LruC domain-containing protein